MNSVAHIRAASSSCSAEATHHIDAEPKCRIAKIIAGPHNCAVVRSPVVGYSIAGPPITPLQPQSTRAYRCYTSPHSLNSNWTICLLRDRNRAMDHGTDSSQLIHLSTLEYLLMTNARACSRSLPPLNFCANSKRRIHPTNQGFS